VKTNSDLSHHQLIAGRAMPGSSAPGVALTALRYNTGGPAQSWSGRVAKVELGRMPLSSQAAVQAAFTAWPGHWA
jgi:hypothetical protein